MNIEGKKSKIEIEQANLANTTLMPDRVAAFLETERKAKELLQLDKPTTWSK